MTVKYLLVDYENVQPKNLALLNGHPFKVIVFLGSKQNTIPLQLAMSLQSFGDDVEYIQISGNGKNALDFHIAFTLGELSKEDKTASFHVVSRDTGFDPLIKYLKNKGIRVTRVTEVAELPALRKSNGRPAAEKVDVVLNRLLTAGNSKPRKVKTLKNTINALFAKSLSNPEVSEIIDFLVDQGLVSIDGESVEYPPANGSKREPDTSQRKTSKKSPAKKPDKSQAKKPDKSQAKKTEKQRSPVPRGLFDD